MQDTERLSGSSRAIVLASASLARRQMLEAAALNFDIQPSAIDEDALKSDVSRLGASDVAIRLAIAKAKAISDLHPEAAVIGSDQVLEFAGALLSKPVDLAEARRHLQLLRGQTHHLHSAAAIVIDGRTTWAAVRTARLVMRTFSDTFLDSYIVSEQDWICQSVGAYRIEGRGVQLFEEIDGDHFTILGMPLLELLKELRRQGAIPG